MSPEQVESERKRKIHAEGLERFRRASNSEEDERRRAMEAFNYNAGNHMESREKHRRLNAKPARPVIELNRTAPAIKRVVNTFRQSPPAGKVIPYGSGASKEAADILQGYVRTMNNVSQANSHKESALEDAAIGGLSWIGLLLDYEQKEPTAGKQNGTLGPEAFYMRPKIRSFDTPFVVYRDPQAQDILFRDGRFNFVVTRMDTEVYKKKWPNSEAATPFVTPNRDVKKLWWTTKETQVAEYWYVTSDEVEICLLADNQVVERKDLPKDAEGKPAEVLNSRIVERNRKIHCATMNGLEILDESEWPGSFIPLIPYVGDRFIEDGIRKIRGMITGTAMAANTLLDYAMTRLAEVLGLSTLSPLMVAFESIPPEFQEIWRTANTEMHSFLPYMAYDEEGKQLPKPTRESTSPEIAGLVTSIGVAIDAIKAEMDTYDASLGTSASSDSSGRQTALRQSASDLGHFHIIDNAGRSEELLTWMLIELAPKIFNRDGILKITDADGSQRDVKTFANQTGNPSMADPKAYEARGVDAIFEMNPREYSIAVAVERGYQTRRQEQSAFILDILKLAPQFIPQLLPTALRASDAPDADKMADIIDPQAQQDIPPQLAAKMKNYEDLIQQLQTALNKETSELEQRQLDRDSKERIASVEASVQTFGIEVKAGMEEMKQTLEFIKHQSQNLSAPGVESEPAAPAQPAAAPAAIPPPNGAPPVPMQPGQ